MITYNTTNSAQAHVHYFDDTGEAYDACQCDARIQNGDILVIESEGVVGIAHTWPFAITENAGKLHRLADGYDTKRIALEDGFPDRSDVAMAIAAFIVTHREI